MFCILRVSPASCSQHDAIDTCIIHSMNENRACCEGEHGIADVYLLSSAHPRYDEMLDR